MSAVDAAAAIDDLLKEIEDAEETGPKAAGREPPPKAAAQDANKSNLTVFSTYAPCAPEGPPGDATHGAASGAQKPRALPKTLDPMRTSVAPVVTFGAAPDPWGHTRKEALPHLQSEVKPAVGLAGIDHVWGTASKKQHAADHARGGSLPGSDVSGVSPTRRKVPLSSGPSAAAGGAGAGVQEVQPRGETVVRSAAVASGIVPMKRWGHASAIVHNSLFVFGGMRAQAVGSAAGGGEEWEYCSDMHEFNLETHTWTPCFVSRGEPPTARQSCGVAVADASVFVFGGIGANGTLLNDLHEYNTDAQEWIAHHNPKPSPETDVSSPPSGPVPPARGECTLVPAGSGKKFYVFGGRCMKDTKEGGRKRVAYMNDLWSFDVKNKKWKHIKNRAAKPSKQAPGHDDADEPQDPATTDPPAEDAPPHSPQHQRWPCRRAGHAACRFPAKQSSAGGCSMFVSGGADASDVFSDLWQYNFDAGTWTDIELSFGIPRKGHSLLAFGDAIFCYGGLYHMRARDAKAERAVLQWLKPARCCETAEDKPTGAWTTCVVHPHGSLQHATPKGSHPGAHLVHIASDMGGGIRNGIFYFFGGRAGVLSGSSFATNTVCFCLVTDDIVAEVPPVSQTLSRLFKKTQQCPGDWSPDLQLMLNGRAKYAHSCILREFSPEFYDLIAPFISSTQSKKLLRECILDGNKRRKGLPGVETADILHNLLYFCYTGRLADYEIEDTMGEVAVELKLAALADHLETVNPRHGIRRPMGSSKSLPASASSVQQRLALAEPAVETALLHKLSRALREPAAADLLLTSDSSSSRHLMAHSPILSAASSSIRKALQLYRSGSPTNSNAKISVQEEQGILKVTLVDVPT
eukprot:gene15856-24229_t